MNLLELYKTFRADGGPGESARALLLQTHWFTVNAEFDPKTGEALPQALSTFLAKVSRPATDGAIRDRLWRIAEHSRLSVERLCRALNESPRREQTLMSVRAVRELDANSFIKLSNRPGRNIREKLAGKPYLQAVRRFQSVNLPENRLLKAFAIRLAEILELRRDCLGENEDELLPKIHSWLLSEEAQAIARWDNMPANNTLLSHRDYRRVWDAWRWLQNIDDDIVDDFSQFERRGETVRLWNTRAQMWADGSRLFAEMPVLFDYERFEVRPWLSQVAFPKAPRKINRNVSIKKILEPVCVDLTVLRPCFANAETASQTLPDAYLWQHWQNGDESIDITLFNSDAAYLHPDTTSISAPDLFFSKDNTPEHLDRAARAFTSQLSNVFKNDTLIWLVPDFLNDFELEIIRRNLNACFPGAEPLPRSVAAAFEQVDYSRIRNDGYPIVVVDRNDALTCATKLIARFDPDLQTRCPDTNGYYWERCPPVIIPHEPGEPAEHNIIEGVDMMNVDAKGQWHDSSPRGTPRFIEARVLKQDPRIGQFAFCMNLVSSPVAGGIRLHALQQAAGDIPLWRDQIPELSITVMKDGRPQRFYLVTRGTTVKPIRGMSVPIPVDDNFTLSAGRSFFEFRLFQGENQDDLGFSARLDSAAFPLPQAAICKLDLTFAYGADEPYTLTFTPLDRSFPSVRARWRRTIDEIITDAPAPEYPDPSSWPALRLWRDAQGAEVDLLEWLVDALNRLLALIPRRSQITISSLWRLKKSADGGDYWFAFANTEEGTQCYCNTKQLAGPYHGNPNSDFPCGTLLYGDLRTRQDGSVAAFNISSKEAVAMPLETKQRIISFRERSLQNRMAVIWADARSLRDTTCPAHFRDEFERLAAALLNALPSDIVERKLMFLLACLHKDTTGQCVQWLTEQLGAGSVRDPRAVGFALGDVSVDWQRAIYQALVSHPNHSTISVFAYAIWRDQHFVERLSLADVHGILDAIVCRLENVHAVMRRGDDKEDKRIIREWARGTAEPLELLLGLLRTRVSPNMEMRMLLQPHQKITKELARQVERVTEVVAQSNVTLFSRVQLNVQKPDGDRTPDLLYALRLYLTGDDGAHAIHVASVSDGDTD